VVLVVDDEPLILDLIQAALEDGGYSVRTASGAPQALEELQRKNPSDIVGLITDIRLGKVDGWEVATRAREVNASMAIVYMTGDSSHDWASQGVPNSVIVQKPFAVAQLVVAISELINAV
jgi:CheY-like chemotaxis protein